MSSGVGTRASGANLAGVVAGVLVILLALVVSPNRRSDDLAGAGAGCAGRTLTVLSSNEPGKVAALQRVAATFGCIQIASASSGVGELRLEKAWAGSGEGPDVWLPADSLWVNLLRENRPDGAALPTVLDPVASSRMTIALTPGTAEKLGWSQGPTWAQIRDQARSGRLVLIKENARNSTSGALATLLAFQAGVGTAGLDVEQARKGAALDFARDIEHAVTWYPSDNVQFLADVADAKKTASLLHGANAMIVQSALVRQFPGLKGTLEAYPIRDPAAVTDQPFVVRPGVDAQTGALARRFNSALRGPAAQRDLAAARFDPPGPRDPGTGYRAGPVVEAVLDEWTSRLRRRVRVAILVDESGSLTQRGFDDVRAALSPALARLSNTDHAVLAGFPDAGGGNIDELTGSGNGGALTFSSPLDLAQRLARIKKQVVADRPTSPILQATDDVADEVLTADPRDPENPEIGAVVVLTDGKQDPAVSKARAGELFSRLSARRDQVHVYVIPVGSTSGSLSMVAEMASRSDGAVLCVGKDRRGCTGKPSDGYTAVFDRIVTELGAKA